MICPLKIRACLVLTASIFALPVVVSGATAGKLSLVWPREGASVSLLTDAQKAYLMAPTESRGDSPRRVAARLGSGVSLSEKELAVDLPSFGVALVELR